MTKNSKIRIGTRGSKLALAQAYEVRDKLIAAHELTAEGVEICVISTEGDRIQDKALREFGGKGLFTKEIEAALLADEIDIAVHSMKDVQTKLPDGLDISCVLVREDVRDAFICSTANSLDELPSGAVVGTASLRRQAQVKVRRDDLRVVTLRGTVQTRLKKIAEAQVDATFLAVAGLNRLGLANEITSKISPDVMLPAVAQGAIGIECRVDDERIRALLTPLNDSLSHIAVKAERAFLTELDGSCRTPIAGLAEITGDVLRFRGQILAPDGLRAFMHELNGSLREAETIGRDCALQLKEQAGAEFLAKMTT